MLPHKKELWLAILCVCLCVHVIWLCDSDWNIDLAQSSEGSSKIVLKLLILKMAREKYWAIVLLSPKVRNLS